MDTPPPQLNIMHTFLSGLKREEFMGKSCVENCLQTILLALSMVGHTHHSHTHHMVCVAGGEWVR